MRSLYLRIWLTVVAALALFAAVSGWLVQRHLEQERERIEASVGTITDGSHAADRWKAASCELRGQHLHDGDEGRLIAHERHQFADAQLPAQMLPGAHEHDRRQHSG